MGKFVPIRWGYDASFATCDSGYQNKWNIHRIGKSAVADWIPMTQK